MAEFEPKNYFEKKEESITEKHKEKKHKGPKIQNKNDSIQNKLKRKNTKR